MSLSGRSLFLSFIIIFKIFVIREWLYRFLYPFGMHKLDVLSII